MPGGDVPEVEPEEPWDERTKRLVEFLQEKWGGKEATCPYCGHLNWGVDPHPYSIPRWDVDRGNVPFFVVTCLNCAQGTLIPAERVDLLPHDFTPREEPEEAGGGGET